jgi:single-stranded DNA-binding protein
MAQALKMPFINTVALAGRLVSNPHPLKGSNDRAGSAFTIAVNRHVRGQKPITTYIDVVAWGSVAEAANKHLQSGDAVLVSGSLNNYDKKNGSGTVKVLQVSAAAVQFLTRRDESAPEEVSDAAAAS